MYTFKTRIGLPCMQNIKITAMVKKGSLAVPLIFLFLSGQGHFAINTYPIVLPIIKNVVEDVYIPAPFENQKIEGIIGLRLNVNLNKRLLQIDQETMLSGFLSRPGKQDWI